MRNATSTTLSQQILDGRLLFVTIRRVVTKKTSKRLNAQMVPLYNTNPNIGQENYSHI